MIRRALECVVAIATGAGTVTALGHVAGPVPNWLAFVAGALVVIASLTGTSIRAEWRQLQEGGDEDAKDEGPGDLRVGGGRHRRDPD